MKLLQDDVPTPIRTLGFLFYVGAWMAAIHIVFGLLFQMRINFDFNVLGFWIGPGLVRGDRRYWTWALYFVWVGVVGVPLFGWLLLVGAGSQLVLKLFDNPIAPMSLIQGVVFAAALELLGFWSLWVLYKYRWFTEHSLVG